MLAMIGRKLAHYEIVDKIGEGGMGEVYRARDLKLGREVALKILPSELAHDPDRRKRFEREARAVAALKHPNIVTLHAIEEADGLTFITMELVEGRMLSSLIGEKGLPLDKLFNIAIPLADALGAAHAQGIAHRDLKPTNIMIDGSGRLKVLDFGLAKLFETDVETEKTMGVDSDTAEGRIMGTVAYMSPEQAEGTPVDHRSDVFSLGVVLYELATGQRPFSGKNNISTISSILKDTPKSVTDIRETLPRHLGRIINRCLAKEPDRRYQSVLDVRNELEGLRAEVTSGDVEMPAGTSRRKPARKIPRKAAIGAVAAIAVVLVAVFALKFLRDGDGTKQATDAKGGTRAVEAQSVAVLPFANMSGDPNNEYFSDGLSEELMNVLAKVPGLRVAARTSSFHFKGKTGDVADIGRQLNVATILEGSVRRAGDRVRVTAQLVQADNGFHLWSDTYDRTLDDVFAIQEDIAGKVVEALKITLLGANASALAKRPTTNMEAYDAYLLGQQRLARRRSDALAEAARHFQHAIDLDPNFALAHVGLAQAYYHLSGYGTLTSTKALEKAMPELERALELDPALGEGHALSGLIQSQQGNVEAGEASFRRAIELNPNNPMAFMWYALLMGGRNLDRRDELIQQALALDPLSPTINVNIGYWLAFEGKTSEAIKQFEHVIEIDPEFVNGYLGLAQIYSNHLDRQTEALELYRKAMELDPGNLGSRLNLGWAYFSLGRTDEAMKAFKETIDRDAGYAPAYNALAWLHRNSGRVDEAVRWSRRALERDPDNDEYSSNLVRFFLTLDDEPSARAMLEEAERKNAGSLSAKLNRTWYQEFRGDLKKTEELTRAIAEIAPARVYETVAFFDIAAGRPADARARIAPFNKPLLEVDDPVVRANVGTAIDACYVLRATGETKRFELLLGKAEAYLASRSPEVRRNLYPWETFESLVLGGRIDDALDEAERLVASGSYPTPWIKTDWAVNAVADQPRWQALMTRVRAELKLQRERLAADTQGLKSGS
jgi:TolB-like protein/cytochrome c-type biogenesis protein CcmH/NrfG